MGAAPGVGLTFGRTSLGSPTVAVDPTTKVIRVAVLVTAGTWPKDLSAVYDAAFKYNQGILQVAVEGHGWPGDGDPTEGSLWDALVDDTASRLLEDPDDQTDDLV